MPLFSYLEALSDVFILADNEKRDLIGEHRRRRYGDVDVSVALRRHDRDIVAASDVDLADRLADPFVRGLDLVSSEL